MIVRRLAELDFRELPGRLAANPLADVDGGGTSVRVVRIEGSSPRAAHLHPRSVEVVYVADGAGRAWQDGEVVRVAAGDTILIPRGVPHATIPESGGSLLLVCFFPDADLATNTEELETVVDLDA